ncbi:putative odorant receptor 92a [Diprion similis]|uniref:putative odorant receptor 92a n=1 Tax=Diprion similis TaxID=362088 RepID=UPI001EF88425|nr:putative odorant receptor 92a [Diprion similis]
MTEKESFDGLARIIKCSLQFFGVLSLNGPPTIWKNRLSKFLTAFTILCISSIIVQVIHLMLSTNLGFVKSIDTLNTVAALFGGGFRMIFIAWNRVKIQRLMSTCESLWQDASPIDLRIISVWTNRAKLLSLSLCLTTVVAAVLWIFSPIIKQVTPGAVVSTRSWPYQINVDSSLSPRYEIIYVIQSASATVCLYSIVGCDLVGPFLALNACGQLKLIQNWLTNIAKKESEHGEQRIDQHVEKTLRKYILRHQIVMNFCAQLEEAVCYANLAQALGGLYVLGISAARLTKMQGSEIFQFFSTFLWAIGQLAISCWPAECLITESTMVAESIYAIPWYRCSIRTRNMVLFMMARSQRPARLTAGKFVTYSLGTLASIISSAVSIFMLLRTIYSAT